MSPVEPMSAEQLAEMQALDDALPDWPENCLPVAAVHRRHLLAEVKRLQAVEAELRKDAERLNWLQSLIDPSKQIDFGGCFEQTIRGVRGETIREALDAGMENKFTLESVNGTSTVVANPKRGQLGKGGVK